jgi:hypothetical protein
MNVIEIICEAIGADPKGTPEEIAAALEDATPEQVIAALKAVVVAHASAPKAKARR